MRKRVGGNACDRAWLLAALLIFVLLLSACKDIQSPKVVKIGLIAPFEGPSRSLGYDTLNAVKLRLAQWNESDAQPKVELVALNDNSDPELAARLPRQLAQDPDIRVILGPSQGHTAMKALPALEQAGIPTLLLAPVSRAAISSDIILSYAGLGSNYAEAFASYFGKPIPVAWLPPIKQPVIWLGDPLTLAEVVSGQSQFVPAAGPVAGEEAFQKWAPEQASTQLWAAPIPQNLPDNFASAYEALAGKPPNHAAALAYAAADQALRIIAAASDYRLDASPLHAIPTPPITLIPTPPAQ